tara:strand:+ start:7824 stop:8267 length:444 start_codon:yes stop_codon:yes gene_type:complete
MTGFLTIGEAAKILEISQQRVRQLAKGKLANAVLAPDRSGNLLMCPAFVAAYKRDRDVKITRRLQGAIASRRWFETERISRLYNLSEAGLLHLLRRIGAGHGISYLGGPVVIVSREAVDRLDSFYSASDLRNPRLEKIKKAEAHGKK